MTKALILGGTGHLGSALRARLQGSVVAYSHHAHPSEGSFRFNILDDSQLPIASVIIGAFPLARQLQAASKQEIEVAVDRYVERCRDTRIVQLSTDAVYSGRQGLRREADAPDALTSYGQAQAAVDAALLDRAPQSLIVRTSFIFGSAGGRLDKRLAPLADDLSRVEAQAWPANVFRSPTEVNFLAEGIVRAIDRDVTGTLNLAGPRMSVSDFFCTALKHVGSFTPPLPIEETDPAIARDTSLSGKLMEDSVGLSSEEVWKWYQRFFR